MEGKPGHQGQTKKGGSGAEQSRYRPFSTHWLDSALHETLLPGSPWQQVNDRIGERLAQSLESDLEASQEERQMIYQLLGPIFVKKFMKNVLYRPDVLDPSVLNADRRKLLQHSAQVLLKERLDGALRDLGYARPSSRASSQPDYAEGTEEQQAEMQAAVDHTRAIVRTGLERECVIRELNLKRAPPKVDKDLEEPEPDTLKLSGGVSDLLGQSVVAVLRRDPSRLDSVCQRLAGRQLPAPLRAYVWRQMLLQAVDSDGKERLPEKFIRKRFAKAVAKGKVDMKISKATECPIGGLIERAVMEKYDATPCMRPYRKGKYQTHTREALNIMYTYNRSYEPFLINWLFPLQLALREESQKEEHPYELSLYLDFLRTYTFPKWPEVFATAERVMARLNRSDGELYNHLQKCAVTNVKVDPQEFLVQLIDAEKRKAAALTRSTASSSSQRPERAADKDLLANPLIFLRKWIGEGFVCVLSKPAVMYLWDQCFMERWHRLVLERACLALLLLLRDRFLCANDYHQMRQVFLKEPSKILTLDLVKAYQQMRATLVDSDEDLSFTPVPVAASPGLYSGEGDKVKLRLASLKDVSVKLIWNLADSHLSGVQRDRIVLSLFVFFGGRVLKVQQVRDSVGLTSHTKSKKLIFDTPPAGGAAEEITLPDKELSVQEKDHDTEPHVVLRVRYKTTDEEEAADEEPDHKDSLGWALIPVYRRLELPSGSDETAGRPVAVWAASNSDGTVPLYFGAIPRDVRAPAAIKRFSSRDLLQEGSEVSFTVFGPEDVDENAPTAEEGFDLYIDGIRFLPDNATVCKVTGRIIHPVNKDRPDILMTAPLDSPARCPRIQSRYKMTSAESTNMAVLRVYTVDKANKAVVIIGSAVLQIFDVYGSGKLRVGGHELRLYHGIVPMEQMSPEAMSALPVIPACTLLVRLLPASKKYVQIPDYEDGSYKKGNLQFSASELRLMEHHKRSPTWRDTVRAKLLELRQDGGDGGRAPSDEALIEWQLDRLDYKKQMPKARGPASHLSLSRCVDYNSQDGLEVAIVAARAINGQGMYPSVAVYVLPGGDLDPALRSSEKDQFLAVAADLSSPQNGPTFTDPPKKLNAIYSNKTLLLFRVVGLPVTYAPDAATVHGEDGASPPSLDPARSYLGWAVVPLFYKGCVAQGTHHLPIFKDTGKFPFLDELTETRDLRDWLNKALASETVALEPEFASLEVAVWDGRFDREDAPLSRESRYLKVGDKKKFLQVAEEVEGPPLSELALKDLPPGAQEEKVLEDFGTAVRAAAADVIDQMRPPEE